MADLKTLLLLQPEDKADALLEARTINLQRARLAISFVAVLDAAFFVWFRMSEPGNDPVRAAWHEAIETTHLLSLLCAAVLLAASWLLFRRSRPAGALLAFEIPVLVWLLSLGIALAVVDQAVTTSITPFLVVCLAVGAVFYHRPLPSLALFVAAYAAFYAAMGLTSEDPAALLSNRVNGLTGVAIGFGLSLAFWRLFLQNRAQRRRIEDQARELARVNGELRHMAFHDALTGLPNRRWADRAVRAESSASRRRGSPASLVVLDLDRFKALNDRFGHPVGDEVLRALARTLAEAVRVSDTVARVGGEEFLLLLPDTPPEGARVLAEKLRERIAETDIPTEAGPVRVTASFGVAALRTDEGQDPQQSYADADAALYRAKNGGRDRVEVHA